MDLDTTPARGTRTPSVDVEGALLRAADRMLRRSGWTELSARAIAAEAGVARMGVYSRFGGLDGLVDALLIRGWEDLARATASHGETDGFARLVDSGLRYRRWALDNREYYEVMFHTARSFASPVVLAATKASFGVLVAHVEFAIATGDLAPGDPVDISQAILNAVHGAVSFELNQIVLAPDVEAAYERTLRAIIRGLQTK